MNHDQDPIPREDPTGQPHRPGDVVTYNPDAPAYGHTLAITEDYTAAELVERMSHAIRRVAEIMDDLTAAARAALAAAEEITPRPARHRTGLDAQRSPHGPQGRRRR